MKRIIALILALFMIMSLAACGAKAPDEDAKVSEHLVYDFNENVDMSAQELADRNYNIDLCGYPHEEEEILPPKELIQQYQEKRASLNADIDRILGQITDILGISFTEEE